MCFSKLKWHLSVVYFLVIQPVVGMHLVLSESMSSQVKYAWKIRKNGEASAETAATETYYMKGYYNLEEETIKVKI